MFLLRLLYLYKEFQIKQLATVEEVRRFHYHDQQSVCNISRVDFDHHFKRKPCRYTVNPTGLIFCLTLTLARISTLAFVLHLNRKLVK